MIKPKSRLQLTRELKKRRDQEQASRKAWREAERDLASLERALARAETRTERLHARFIQNCVTLADVRAQLRAQGPAIVQTIVAAPSVPMLRSGGHVYEDGMSVERIAKHLGYGSSGRTRTELSKTLDSGLSKVRAKLKEVV